MQKRFSELVVLGLVFSTIACNLTGVLGPTPTSTPTTLIQQSTQLPTTPFPSAVPFTTVPTSVVANCSGAPQSQLAIGMTARVSPGTANNLRSQPSTVSSLVTTLPPGLEVDIVGGPICADGYQWWQVKSQQTQGWTVEGNGSSYWLVPAISVPVQVLMPAGATSQTVSYGNVTFTFTATLSDHVLARTVFGAPRDPNIPMFLNTSQRLEFTLNDFQYTATSRPMLLTVYKISDLEASDANYTPMVAAMRTLLAQHTPLAVGVSLSTPITVIPVQNAGQAFHAQSRYFKFLNGTGVRFVTYYTQNPGPVDNQSLFYVYQGLTDDGLYYISALIPITTRSLGLLPTWQNPGDTATLNAYLTQVVQKVDTFGAKDFTPALDDLDAWIASIQVK